MPREMSAMPKFPFFNTLLPIVEKDGTSNRTFYAWCHQVWMALTNTQAKINAPTGGETVDAEARQAISDIIQALEKFGITKE